MKYIKEGGEGNRRRWVEGEEGGIKGRKRGGNMGAELFWVDSPSQYILHNIITVLNLWNIYGF